MILKKPKISVVMTVYNAEKFIKLSINSILHQSFKNFELIIVDDCSSDLSKRVIKDYSDKRIKNFFLKNHIGRTPALNYGLKKAKGEFIAILDADDLSHKDRLKIQYKFLNKNKTAKLVCTLTKFINERNQFIKNFWTPRNIDLLNKMILYENVISHSSIMFKKKFLKKVGYYPTKYEYAQDYALILRFALKTRLYLIPKYLTKNRVVNTSMSKDEKLQKIIILEKIKFLDFVLKEFRLDFLQILMILKNCIKETLKLILNLIKF